MNIYLICVLSGLISLASFDAEVPGVNKGDTLQIVLQKPGRYKKWYLTDYPRQLISLENSKQTTATDRFVFKTLKPGSGGITFNLKYEKGTETVLLKKSYSFTINPPAGRKVPVYSPAATQPAAVQAVSSSTPTIIIPPDTTVVYSPVKTATTIPYAKKTPDTFTVQTKPVTPDVLFGETGAQYRPVRAESMRLIATEREKEYFELAEAVFKRGLYQESISELEKLLNKYPKGTLREITHTRIAESYFHIGLQYLNKARAARKKRNKTETTAAYEKAVENFDKSSENYKDILDNFTQGEYMEKNQYLLARGLWNGAMANLELDDYTKPFTTDIDTHRFDRSVIEFLRLTIRYKHSPYTDNAFFEIGMYYKTLADYYSKKNLSNEQVRKTYKKALNEFKYVILNYPGTDGAVLATYWTGWIYDRVMVMRDFEMAVAAYRKLLMMKTKYPELKDKFDFAKKREKIIIEKYL